MRSRRIQKDEKIKQPTSGDPKDPLEVEADVIDADGRVSYPLDLRQSSALVIHCADPRFQAAFRRFVTEELGIATYTPLVIGGGAQSFGAQTFLPKNFKVAWQQVKFFISVGNLREVVIINHEDCLWYRHMSGYHPTIELPTKQKLDLAHTAKMVLADFAGVRVRSFMAKIDGDHVYFVPVERA